MKVMALTSMI